MATNVAQQIKGTFTPLQELISIVVEYRMVEKKIFRKSRTLAHVIKPSRYIRYISSEPSPCVERDTYLRVLTYNTYYLGTRTSDVGAGTICRCHYRGLTLDIKP